ncbi:hypothetical protein GQ55_8G169900 [Panicum hallii var. hallii]|uniref:Uncharacterized protein n=1 Tax=Panicum hallii var. hallii TaxID=1504633 RepID=A0A2T7CNK2_9POAL|nr:hypothetical protein GQ55_8G169900 [Panicum hallii var. hallii]
MLGQRSVMIFLVRERAGSARGKESKRNSREAREDNGDRHKKSSS